VHYLKVHQFVNEERTKMRKSEGVDYLRFQRDGDLSITPGNVTDFRTVRDHIIRAAETYNITAVAYDRRFSTYIVPELIDAGIDMQPMGQGFLDISMPTKMFEMEVVKGTVIHGGNACLRWQMGCVKLDRDAADNIKVTKGRTKYGQMVDGVVASIMAFGCKLNSDDDDVIYEVVTL